MVAWGEERYDLAVATTMGLTTLSLMHIVAALEAREPTGTIFSRYTIANRRFVQLIGAALVLTFLVTELQPLQRIFDTVSLTSSQWGICLLGPIVFLAVAELGKLARPPHRTAPTGPGARRDVGGPDRRDRSGYSSTSSSSRARARPSPTATRPGPAARTTRGSRTKSSRPRPRRSSLRGIEELSEAQELLWASDRYALLVVLQAMDAAGKDSAIEHVMTGVNPQGVQVVGFRQPSSEELDHDFLWRISKALPERGRIGIFNRSHYEEVIALRVHPEWLDQQRLPTTAGGRTLWEDRYEDINAFERHLDRNGTKIVKFFLHVSKEEQKKRFLARLDTPGKEWKFNAADVAERALWDEYMAAFEAALTATSTPWAPWYVIPADHKWLTQALVARILVDTIQALDLSWPEVTDDERKANLAARKKLEAEP